MKKIKDTIRNECDAILDDLDPDYKRLGKARIEAFVISYSTYIGFGRDELLYVLEKYIILSAIEDNKKVILVDREGFKNAIPS